MKYKFKQILLEISRLSRKDQQWIIDHLGEEERGAFSHFAGEKLLKKAALFRHIILEKELEPPIYFPQTLGNHPPLYLAIILEQGQFDWAALFLQKFDSDKTIQNLLATKVKEIKPAAKQAIFKHWQNNFNFAQLMETQYG